MGNLRFPPEAPPCTSSGIPLPFQSRAPPRPSGVLVFQQKLRFRNTRTCRHGIAWRGTPRPHVIPTPFPPYGPAKGLGVLRSCPHPGNPSDGGTGYARKGSSLVLTSCRPAYGDGCVRPPVPKAKLWLEQAGSEHRASARGKGGDSGVWKGASKGGNAPITGPFPPPGGHKGKGMERRGENGKMQVVPATNSTTHLPVRPAGGAIFLRSCPPPGNPSDGGPGGTHKGPPLAVTSCRPAYGDSPPGGHEGRVVERRG